MSNAYLSFPLKIATDAKQTDQTTEEYTESNLIEVLSLTTYL